MKRIIYYFSGRGNSYYTAKVLAEKMDDSVIIPLSKAKNIDMSADSIGVVTPVIDLGIPSCVRRFLGTLQHVSQKPYLFAVVTCGGMPAASLNQLKNLAAQKGHLLSAGFLLTFGLEPLAAPEFNRRMEEIAAIVNKKEAPGIPKSSFKDKILSAAANPLARLIIPNEDRKFVAEDGCIGCGTCSKMCPVHNIRMVDGRPVWQHRCTQCAACFGWCPQKAISGKNLASKTHYTHPQVSLQDMLEKQ